MGDLLVVWGIPVEVQKILEGLGSLQEKQTFLACTTFAKKRTVHLTHLIPIVVEIEAMKASSSSKVSSPGKGSKHETALQHAQCIWCLLD